MNKSTLYFSPGTCAQVTAAALEEIGLPYELVVVDFRSSEARAHLIAVNSKGKVPTLVVDGEALVENPAILWFLNERHPGSLLPVASDPIGRQRQLSDLVWCGSDVHPTVRQVRMPQRWTSGETAGVTEDGTKKLRALAMRVEQRVGAEGWWYTSGWSIIDTYLWWSFRNAERGGFDAHEFEFLQRYLERIELRPSTAAVIKREKHIGIAPIETPPVRLARL